MLVITEHKPHSAFKLKNPQDDKTYSLARSHWLPESSLGSQPYIICCEGELLRSWRKTKSVSIEKYDLKDKGVKDDHKGRGNKKEGNINGESNQDGNERSDDGENGESVSDTQDGNNADNEVEDDPSVNNGQGDNEAGNDSKKEASNVKSKANNEYIITYREYALSKITFSDRLFIIERGHKT